MSFTDTMLDRAYKWLQERQARLENKDPYEDLTAKDITVTHVTGKPPLPGGQVAGTPGEGVAILNNRDAGVITTFTARYKGTEIGSVKVKITARGYGYVHDMKVPVAVRRHGVARVLMGDVANYYLGVCRLELVPHSPKEEPDPVPDEVLEKFYASFGFTRMPTVAERPGTRASDERRMARLP